MTSKSILGNTETSGSLKLVLMLSVQDVRHHQDVIDFYLFSNNCLKLLGDSRSKLLPGQLQMMIDNQHMDHVFAVSGHFIINNIFMFKSAS